MPDITQQFTVTNSSGKTLSGAAFFCYEKFQPIGEANPTAPIGVVLSSGPAPQGRLDTSGWGKTYHSVVLILDHDGSGPGTVRLKSVGVSASLGHYLESVDFEVFHFTTKNTIRTRITKIEKPISGSP